MKSNKLIGAAFITFPIAINFPFAMLASRFDYPDILRAPAGQVLERFHAGGTSLVLIWYAFAITMIPVLAAMLALPLLPGSGNRLRLGVATTFGAIATVFQILGLIRWTFVVPVLANIYTDPNSTEAMRTSAAVTFAAFHQYAGVAIGEHLGQLFTAIWMGMLGFEMLRAPLFRAWLGWLGLVGAILWIIGLAEGFATVLPFHPGILAAVAPVAFLVMGIWMICLGVVLWRETGEEAEADRTQRSGQKIGGPRRGGAKPLP